MNDHYRERLLELLDLPEDWDSYGGKKIDPAVVGTLAIFLQAVQNGDLQIVPLPNGGVQIEYHGGGIDVEMEFEPRLSAETGDMNGIWESVL